MPREDHWTAPFSLPEQDCRPAGYAWLVQKYQLDVLPHWRWTFIANRHVHRELERHGAAIHLLPPPRWPGSSDLEHLLFALRTDGVSLPIHRALFRVIDLDELGRQVTAEVGRTPTGAYARRAWFLYEQLTGRTLPLLDVHQGNYVPLLNPTVHVTGLSHKHRRQRIDVNTLGPLRFAPVVRWTTALREVSGAHLTARIEDVVSGYDDPTVRRAISYLYTRETMASYEMERERPPRTRAERFVALLQEAPTLSSLGHDTLVGLQNAIVDRRFADESWRQEQNYVGESLDLARQRVHYVCPKPEDLPELMEGYIEMAHRLIRSQVLDPVLATAILSFGFVLLHPFTDGNGRLHRWLIHWGLSRSGITPGEIIIPVSAVMLSRRREYDEALESYSRPLMPRVSYDLDADGRMTVRGETVDLYRHPDLTRMVEGLWTWLEDAVERDLADQLRFLMGLDQARQAIQEIVDMPDRLIVLFIKVCRGNGGSLSRRKRERHFDMLTDDEVADMEHAVQRYLLNGA